MKVFFHVISLPLTNNKGKMILVMIFMFFYDEKQWSHRLGLLTFATVSIIHSTEWELQRGRKGGMGRLFYVLHLCCSEHMENLTWIWASVNEWLCVSAWPLSYKGSEQTTKRYYKNNYKSMFCPCVHLQRSMISFTRLLNDPQDQGGAAYAY